MSNKLIVITPTGKASPAMDPAIWSSLPMEILERVLCFLPLNNLISLRTTCKRFQSLIFTRSFITQHQHHHRHQSSSSNSLNHNNDDCFPSFLVLSHPHFHPNYLLYDFSTDNWRTSQLYPTTQTQTHFPLICSSNGILCFSLPSSSYFLVCTTSLPSTSTLVKFPKLPFSFELLTLVPAPRSRGRPGRHGSFRILAVSSDSLLVYDSEANSWTTQFHHLQRIIRDGYHQEGIYRQGSLFFTSTNPISVIRFHLDSGKLERVPSQLPQELVFMRLVDYCSEGVDMYMFGGVGGNGISRSLKLWQLADDDHEPEPQPPQGEQTRGTTWRWVEVETLPDMMYKKFVSVCYHNYNHVYCFWHQGNICICCHTWPEVLYYKVARRTWHWLPKCPSLPDKWSCGFKWFSFVPRLCSS